MSIFSSIERGRITRLHFKGRLTRSALRTTCIHNCVYLVTRLFDVVFCRARTSLQWCMERIFDVSALKNT